MTEHFPEAVVKSVNIGAPRTVTYRGAPVQTSIWKTPVEGAVPVRGVHVGDDVQSDPSVHGGWEKAVYAYAVEDLAWWGAKLGRALEPGTFGENLTIRGLDVSGAVVGEQWRIGTAMLQVTEPRLPCFKLGIRMGDGRFPKRFGKAALLGAYLTIVEEGELRAGDGVEIIHRPTHGVTVAVMGRMRLGEPKLAEHVVLAPQISERWRRKAESFLQRESA
jgi:MOSC domain-containing protein YiiM